MRRYWIGFGLPLAFIAVALGVWIHARTGWRPYIVYLVACNVITVAAYGADKTLAPLRGPRFPEALLLVLPALGGFVGAWLGIAVFRHKSNWRRHPKFLLVTVTSAAGYCALAYVWWARGF